MDFKFGGKYILEQEIANGGCGTVFLGTHHIANKQVAIKLEPYHPPHPHPHPQHTLRKSKSQPQLHHVHRGQSPLTTESQIYKRLMGAPGVPFLMYSGKQGPYNVMVIDLLGSSLEDLFKMCNRSFSLKTVLLLADQCLVRIKYIHNNHLLHRDIKPANFVMGRASPSTPTSETTVNIIDFGLAKKYRDPLTGEHIPYYQNDNGLHGVGTSLFASLNTHLGIESSRRDDLESLAYMLIYFLRGTLPWRKLRAPTHPPAGVDPATYNPTTHTWNLIRDAKLKVEKDDTLCKGLPEEFSVFYKYTRHLSFTDLPDYDGLRALFRGLAERANIEYDGVFDWSVPPPPSDSSSHPGHRHMRRSNSESPGTALGGGGRFCEACNKRALAAELDQVPKRRR
ncbi:casein kinase i [Moniliophthora roreri MCA 2997]|uniref:non-specific serine/threonine protein kinase n=2 Tax=Moniliophthora roreri TaxID=221103 RepID=V2WHK3_MONRO|nr:casein kinase i [Moniliophthora roreri MCA 2997]KAI3614056.1 casein kinase i [Moniliophthora roreri]